MKSLAEAFLGRAAAYEKALQEGPAALTAVLQRNVYVDRRDAAALARYVAASVRALDRQPLQRFVDGLVPFPPPAQFLGEPGGGIESTQREAVT